MRVFWLVLCFCLFCGAVTAQPGPLIGFCWVSNPLSDSTLFEEGFRTAHYLGCQIEHRQYNWNEMEKEKGVYNLNMVDQWYTACTTYNIIPSLAVCPLNSNSVYRNLPEDLEGNSFDDPEVIERLKQFTDTLVGQYPDIKYISFGNEINYYLRAHWDEVFPYCTMCGEMYNYVKKTYPHLRVLVIFGFTGMEKREEELIPLFMPACDIIGISSYHASISVESVSPRLTAEEMRQRLEYCITLCGEKRVAVVETSAFSYPDPVYQATYVHVFFEVIDTYQADMEFACWFSTYDWSPGMLTMVDPFLEQFNSSGLLQPDGTPKLSYYAWMDEMSQRGLVSQPASEKALAAILAALLVSYLLKKGYK